MNFHNSKGLLLLECFTLLSFATFVFGDFYFLGKENDIGEVRQGLGVSNEADLPSELIIRDLQSQRINDQGKVLKKLGELFDRFPNKPAAFDVLSKRIDKLLNKINALKEVIEEEEKFHEAEVTSKARKFSKVEEFPELNGISKEEHFNEVEEEVENEAWGNKLGAKAFEEEGLFEEWEEDVVTEKWKKQEPTEVWEEERGQYADEVIKTKKKRAVEDTEELEEDQEEELKDEIEELEEEEEKLEKEREELEEEKKELEVEEEELKKEVEELEKDEEDEEIAIEEKEENELSWRDKRENTY